MTYPTWPEGTRRLRLSSPAKHRRTVLIGEFNYEQLLPRFAYETIVPEVREEIVRRGVYALVDKIWTDGYWPLGELSIVWSVYRAFRGWEGWVTETQEEVENGSSGDD